MNAPENHATEALSPLLFHSPFGVSANPGIEPEAMDYMNKLAVKLMADIGEGLSKDIAKPEQAVAVLLLTSVGFLGPVIAAEPNKRGKLINLMCDEYRRLLQRYLPYGK